VVTTSAEIRQTERLRCRALRTPSTVSRMAQLVLATVLASALAGCDDGAAARTLSVAARPGLYPAFNPGIHDYVSRCGKTHRLRLSVTPADGGTAAVNAGKARSAPFRVHLRVRSGRRTVVVSRGQGRTARYHVRCLPRRFPHWTTTRNGRTQAAFYLVTPSPSRFVAMFDSNGVPIWWTRASTVPFDAKLLANDHVAWSRHHTGERFGVRRSGSGYEEHTLRGRFLRVRRAVGSPTDHHDMQPLRNGHWVMISYRRRNGADLRPYGGPRNAKVIDAVIQEVDRRGRVRWQWSSRHRISPREQGPKLVDPVRMPDGTKAYDLLHLNSVQVHDHGRRLLVSVHATNAVYDIDRRTKKIVWKLGGTKTPQRLKPLGDTHPAHELLGHQHDARILPDGTVTVHDNGTGLSRPPRALRFRIDKRARTATRIEDIAPESYIKVSGFGGSARRLPHGNWVISWGGTTVVSEVAPSSRVLFALRFARGVFSFKAAPIMPGVVTRGRLRRAMDAQYRR
jgi:hypothetical protein